MANSEKFTRAACGHMFAHYERAKDKNGDYIQFGNQSIDTSRSEQNYNLAIHQKERQGEFVKKRCGEVHCLNRKDVNVMCSWIVTQPQNFPQEDRREFFEQTYKFLENRYGKENVVSSYVHMDETTPHMHFAFVPVVYDKKKERLTVSAKQCINRNELSIFHKDLSATLNTYFRRNIGLHTDITAIQGGHKTISELKRETTEELENIKANINALKMHENELQGKVMNLQEVNALNGKRSLTGGLKGISYTEYLSLKKTAEKVDTLDLRERNLTEREQKIAVQEENILAEESNIALKRSEIASTVHEGELRVQDLSERERILNERIIALEEEYQNKIKIIETEKERYYLLKIDNPEEVDAMVAKKKNNEIICLCKKIEDSNSVLFKIPSSEYVFFQEMLESIRDLYINPYLQR